MSNSNKNKKILKDAPMSQSKVKSYSENLDLSNVSSEKGIVMTDNKR